MRNGDENSESETSSDNDTDVDEEDCVPTRGKREIAWCGNYSEDHVSGPPRAVWPPPSSSSDKSEWSNLRHVRVGNPLLGSKMQLYSKTQHYLAIYPDGEVRGTRDSNDLHTYLELQPASPGGFVRIKALLTNLYVAMNNHGRLTGELDQSEESTVFQESFQGRYKTYLFRLYSHLGWFIGIKKSGRIKPGPKTAHRQKAVKFLSIRTKFQ